MSLISGDLVLLRRQRGEYEIDEVIGNEVELKKELYRLTDIGNARANTARYNDIVFSEGDNDFVRATKRATKNVLQSSNGNRQTSIEFRKHWKQVLDEYDKLGRPLNRIEFEAFKQAVEIMYTTRSFLLSENVSYLNWETVFQEDYYRPPIDETRRRLEITAGRALYQDRTIRGWVEKIVREKHFLGISDQAGLEDLSAYKNRSLITLSSFFPPETAIDIISSRYEMAIQESDIEKKIHLLWQLYVTNLWVKGSCEWDLKLLKTIFDMAVSSGKLEHAIWGYQTIHRESYFPRAYFKERYIAASQNGVSEKFAKTHYGFLELALKNPQLNGSKKLVEYLLIKTDGFNRYFEIALWTLDSHFLQAVSKKSSKGQKGLPIESLFKNLQFLLKSPAWDPYLKKFYTGINSLNTDTTLDFILVYLNTSDNIFNRKQTIDLVLDIFVKMIPDNLLEKKDTLSFLFNIVSKCSEYSVELSMAVSNHYLGKGLNFLQAAKKQGFTSEKIRQRLFQNNLDNIIGYILASEIDDKKRLEFIREYIMRESRFSYSLIGASKDGINRLKALLKSNGIRGVEFLNYMQKSLEMKNYSGHTNTFVSSIRNDELEKAKEAGLVFAPHLFHVLSQSINSIKHDFLKDLGEDRLNKNLATRDYSENFLHRFDIVKKYFSILFSSDDIKLEMHRKHLARFNSIDEIAEVFIPLIPSNLPLEKKYELWRVTTNKRSNKFTDEYFESFSKDLQITTSEKSGILKYGRFSSEKLKLEYVRDYCQEKYRYLNQQYGNIPNTEVQKLVTEILYFMPQASKYRDSFLDKISWIYGLNRKQIELYVEPLKSYTFQQFDSRFVNLLSVMGVLIEILKNKEKLDLVEYIRHPVGSIFSVIPRLKSAGSDLRNAFRRYSINLGWNELDHIRHLEGLIADASDTTKNVLIELCIGLRGTGLWYVSDKLGNYTHRDKLFGLLGLSKGSNKRQMLEAYFESVSDYEVTITLSYLLSISKPGGKFDLVTALESFNAPGIKFAQISSILQIFGPEESEKLKKTKDRASVPAKIEVYKWLEKLYPEELYRKIKHIHTLLGSGSIKVVALIEFVDGKRVAAYIKRPYLKETNFSTLNIARRWIENLQSRESFRNKHDYTFLINQLEEQLQGELDFIRERFDTVKLQTYYSGYRRKGWKFGTVGLIESLPQNENIMHFEAIESAVKFESLSASNKLWASELIVHAELDLLLVKGIFDADRTMGNYLFNEKNRTIYPIDLAQVHRLKKSMFSRDDRSFIANFIYMITASNRIHHTENLVNLILSISNFESKNNLESFFKDLHRVLNSNLKPNQVMLEIMSVLSTHRIYLPGRISMGVIKGLSILLNEDYSHIVDENFVKSRLKRFVKFQLIKHKSLDLIRQKPKAHFKASKCAKLLEP